MELSPMDDSLYMREALIEAENALKKDEIPVGAVIVRNGEIIGRGSNIRSLEGSPLGHAEIVAMQEASKVLKNWRFDDCTLYVTLEPCVMCAGAMVQSRLNTLVYGASDPKAGAVGSLYNILRDPRMYHRCIVRSGILKEECAELLRIFFQKRRKKEA
jgi:tRNA(adenine34) deaminase